MNKLHDCKSQNRKFVWMMGIKMYKKIYLI